MGDDESDLPPFVLLPAARSPEDQPVPPTRRSRLTGYAVVAGIVAAFVALNVAMLAELAAIEAFVGGERVVVSCGADDRCTIARSGPMGGFRRIGTFPADGVVAADPNCGPGPVGPAGGGGACRPGLWLTAWDGPDPALPEQERSFELPPSRRPDGAVFVPWADRSHGAWHPVTSSELDRLQRADGARSLRFDTHRWLPFPAVAGLLAVEAVVIAFLVAVVARRMRRGLAPPPPLNF